MPADGKYYTDTYDWYAYRTETTVFWPSWPKTAPSGTSGIGNPCPSGWRLPNTDELNALLGDTTHPAYGEGTHGSATVIGFYLDGTGSASSSSSPMVFLPAAGVRKGDDGSFANRSEEGRYWSSASDPDKNNLFVYDLKLTTDSVALSHLSKNKRCNGYSIRCVMD